jgi:EmrB/QacA subfamily drug resistance transporter
MANPSSGLRGTRATLAVVVACAAQFLIGVDGLAVAVALPTLQTDLHVAVIDAQWVLTAYGSAFGGALLLGGRLGDLYGRRRLLVGGLAVFAGGSLLAAAAPGLTTLIAARAVQGLGAAAAVPAALALIGSLFPPGPARTRALALLAAMTSMGVMTGLLTGGVITDLLGWRWVFLLIAPLAAIAAVAAPRVLPEARADQPATRPDVTGAALVTAGLVAVLFGLTRIEHHGVAAIGTVLPLAAGLTLLAAFVAWERRVPMPLVRFEVLRVRSLRAASLGAGLNSIAFTSIVYVGTLYLQSGLGYRPSHAGLALLPVDVVAFVVALLVGGPVAHRSPRALLAGSFTLTALALLWLARAPVPANYLGDVMAPLILLGGSLSVAFVVLTQQAVADVHPDDKGLASGIFETANHLFGGALGVALYATILTATASNAAGRDGYRAAFLAATALAAFGLLTARQAGQRRSAGASADRPEHQEPETAT